MVDNLTNLTGSETFYDLVIFANQVTDDIMVSMFILVVYAILISSFSRRSDMESSILISSFICLGLSIILASINLLNAFFIFFFAGAMAITGLYIRVTKK